VQLGIDDRVATFHFISALISMTTSLSTLLVGASLYPLEIRERSRKELVAWLEEQAITVTAARMILPQMFHSLPEEEVLPKLRVVTFGGDAFHSRYIEWARESFSPDLIRVGLACTETGAISQLLIGRDMEVPDGAMPAGYVVEGKQVLLLDEEAQECSDGEAGEIAVRSRYLSPGYWRQPELTRARFLPDPEGGDKRIYLTGDLGRWLSDACSPSASQGPHDSRGRCLVHLGRKDEQVKIRGYRVEIGEVEHALFALQAVREAVVVGRQDREGGDSPDDHGDPAEHSTGRRLVAYVVSEMPTPPTVTGLRRELERTLPDYMIPSTFVFLDALPRSKVGKVDRQALPAPGRSRPNLAAAYVAPCSPIEETLAGIWAELLELECVGVHDDFFELGGDSILVMQVLSRMREKLEVELSLQQFFKTPTIAGLARSVEEARKGARAGVGEIKPISRRPRLGDG
jgi:acyl-coenzyme A synthetase/AMP-(fatty) acid ligase/acyl carrier protein